MVTVLVDRFFLLPTSSARHILGDWWLGKLSLTAPFSSYTGWYRPIFVDTFLEMFLKSRRIFFISPESSVKMEEEEGEKGGGFSFLLAEKAKAARNTGSTSVFSFSFSFFPLSLRIITQQVITAWMWNSDHRNRVPISSNVTTSPRTPVSRN